MSGQKLLVRGVIASGANCAICGEIWRGMLVLDRDDLVAGAVAAVVLDCSSQTISHLLMGQLPPTAVYRLIPIALIDHVAGERLWLQISQAQIHSLSLHDPNNLEETR